MAAKEHGRIVHEVEPGREVAFDATTRDPEVDEIFDRVAGEIAGQLKQANQELREHLRELRKAAG
jgi:hypothetical protein